MDPFSMAAMAVSAVSSIAQGQAAGAQANAAAANAADNARTARLQANAQEEIQRRQNALRMGEIRASAAESGFDPSSGSLLALQTKSAAEMELDALTTRYEGELQSISFQNQAASYRAEGKAARRTGYLNAFGTLTSAAAKEYARPRIGPPAPVTNRDLPRG